MTVTARTPTVEDRRTTLRWLARDWEKFGPAVREIMLASTVHASMNDDPFPLDCTCGICLGCSWADYLTDLAHLDGLNHEAWADGPLGIDDELPYETRLDNAAQRVAALEDLLLHGTGTRGRQAGLAAPADTGHAA
jgi:hypothetical protein